MVPQTIAELFNRRCAEVRRLNSSKSQLFNRTSIILRVRGMFELNYQTTGPSNYWDVEQLTWTRFQPTFQSILVPAKRLRYSPLRIEGLIKGIVMDTRFGASVIFIGLLGCRTSGISRRDTTSGEEVQGWNVVKNKGREAPAEFTVSLWKQQ